jgi:hypothetical protein
MKKIEKHPPVSIAPWIVADRVYSGDDRHELRRFQSAVIGLLVLAIYWAFTLTDPATGEISLSMLSWNPMVAFCCAATIGIGTYFHFAFFIYLGIDPFWPLNGVLTVLDMIGFCIEVLVFRALFHLQRSKWEITEADAEVMDKAEAADVAALPPGPWKVVDE